MRVREAAGAAVPRFARMRHAADSRATISKPRQPKEREVRARAGIEPRASRASSLAADRDHGLACEVGQLGTRRAGARADRHPAQYR